MSFRSILTGIFGSPAGKSVAAFATNELDRAVVAAKSTAIGKAAVDAIHTFEAQGLDGPTKLALAVAKVAPVVASYVAKGGLPALAKDAEAFARLVIESTLADIKKTQALSIAGVVLRLLGLA